MEKAYKNHVKTAGISVRYYANRRHKEMSVVKEILVGASLTNGEYGYRTVLSGIFPDGTVIVGEEKPGAIHTPGTGFGRNSLSEDIWERGYEIREDLLRPGDFVVLESNYSGDHRLYGSHGGGKKILAHRLPLGEIPEDWKPINGQKSVSWDNGYGEKTTWSFLRTKDGSPVEFREVVAELGLSETPHPYGTLYVNPDGQPVAVSAEPRWASGNQTDYKNEFVVGRREFFAGYRLAVLGHEDRDTYYGAGDYYTCTREITRRENLGFLRREGWYPVEVRENYVVWATGLQMYPKHLEWQVGLDPTGGTREDTRGTRIFDNSPNRGERMRQFFREALGVAICDPKAEYIRWANSYDPRGGKWHNSHQYPDSWLPHFQGWGLDRFAGLECRWKQPLKGAARYYGVLNGEHPIEQREAPTPTGYKSAMVEAMEKAGLV